MEHGPPVHLEDLVASILSWQPEVLADERYYADDVDHLPHLPCLSSLEMYKQHYKVAMRAEMHQGLHAAIRRPGKLSRPIAVYGIAKVGPEGETKSHGHNLDVLRLSIGGECDVRPLDFAFLSQSPNPWLDTSTVCTVALVRHVSKSRSISKNSRIIVEILHDHNTTVVEAIGAGHMYLSVIANLASGYRIFDALCQSEYSGRLCDHIFDPKAIPTAETPSANFEHVSLVERFFSHLNQSQKYAVLAGMRCLSAPPCYPILIHGPPGTGKTSTLSAMLQSMLRMDPDQLIHVAAPSNAAMREVAIRFYREVQQNHVIPVSRILLFGNEESIDLGDGVDDIYFESKVKRLDNIDAKLAQFQMNCEHFYDVKQCDIEDLEAAGIRKTWDWRYQTVQVGCEILFTLLDDLPPTGHGPARQSVTPILTALREWLNATRPQETTLDDPHRDIVDGCLPKVSALRVRPIRNIVWSRTLVAEARIIFSTINAAGRSVIKPIARRKPIIVIDEATQCIEPEMLIPLSPDIRGLICIGDAKQLPPTIQNESMRVKGWAKSLFERLISCSSPSWLLNEQYRMYPTISRWPNDRFYDGQLLDSPAVTAHGRSPSWQDPANDFTRPFSFVGVNGFEEDIAGTRSYRNVEESKVVILAIKQFVELFRQGGLQGTVSIACIAGYAQQVELLRHKIASLPDSRVITTKSATQRMIISPFSGLTVTVEVASVDAYQGRESDIVLFCTTRANSEQSIGFLGDPRRLNVALTRARHCLKVIGHEHTLSSSECWRALLLHCRQAKHLTEAHRHLDDYKADPARGFTSSIARSLPLQPQRARLVAQNQSGAKQTRTALANGMAALSDLSVDSPDHVWRVVFTKTCKKQFGELDRSTALRIAKACSIFYKGYPDGARSEGFAIKSWANMIKPLNVDKYTLLWSVRSLSARVSSPEFGQSEKRYTYTQAIWIWACCKTGDTQNTSSVIRSVCTSMSSEYLEVCAATLPYAGGRVAPVTIVRDTPLRERESTLANQAEESSAEEQLTLTKAFELDFRAVQALVDGFLSQLELPFILSAEEVELVHGQGGTLVVGRSGTGKTTVMVLRIFANACVYGHECPQILLTMSSRLASAIQEHFRRLRQSWDLDKDINMAANLMSGLGIMREEDWLANCPSLQDVDASRYPLFWSFDTFFRMLDKSLPGQRFYGYSTRATSLATVYEVDEDRFRTHYQRNMPEMARRVFGDGAAIFTEVQSAIKGSVEALNLGRPLSRSEYLARYTQRVNTLTLAEMELVYDSYVIYEKRRAERGEFDQCDAVFNLFERCKSNPATCCQWSFATISVDEVQDLNPSALALLKFLLNGPSARQCFHAAGDQAQILGASTFRFEDLRSMYHQIYLPYMAGTDKELAGHLNRHRSRQIPPLSALTQNYRSTQNIIALGNAVLDEICRLYPEAIDQLPHNTGLAQGSLPVFLETESEEDFIRRAFGCGADWVSGSNVEWGADQAVITMTTESKVALKKILGDYAIVLTIKQAKGLEFEDVLLYDFFENSRFDRWRVLDPVQREISDFDPLRDQALLGELKQLYVSVSRARTNLWFFDRSSKGAAMRSLWSRLGLVTIMDDAAASGRLSTFTRGGTVQQFKDMGTKFMATNNYAEALSCFTRAGAEPEKMEAQAYLHVATATEYDGSGKAKLVKQAATELYRAAELFAKLGKHRLAAEHFQRSALAGKRPERYVSAARSWEMCQPRSETGPKMLRCLVAAGSFAYVELLRALELPWISRDVEWEQILMRFAYRFGDKAGDDQVRRLALLFPQTDTQVTFLEDLNRSHILVELLTSAADWRRLAHVHEAQAELTSAAGCWSKIGRDDIVQEIDRCQAVYTAWTHWKMGIGRTPDSVVQIHLDETVIRVESLGTVVEKYKAVMQTCASTQKLSEGFEFSLADDEGALLSAYEALANRVRAWLSERHRHRAFADLLQQNQGGSSLELLKDFFGVYITKANADLAVISAVQLNAWASTSNGKAGTGKALKLLTISDALSVVAAHIRRVISATDQKITSDLAEFGEGVGQSQLAKQHNPDVESLRLRAEHLIGCPECSPADVRGCVILIDELVNPLRSQHTTPLSRTTAINQLFPSDLQYELVTKWSRFRQEVSIEAAMIGLRWTSNSPNPINLPCNNIAMALVSEAITYSQLRPKAGFQPLAELAKQLFDFRKFDQLELSTRSRLWLLDKIVFAWCILHNRLHETVLPVRLLNAELKHRSIREAIAALIRRDPFGRREDNVAYYRSDDLAPGGHELTQTLLDILMDADGLQAFVAGLGEEQRNFCVMRLVVLTFSLCCSRNVSDGKSGAYGRDCLRRLGNICSLADKSGSDALGFVTKGLWKVHDTKRDFIQTLRDIADLAGDPLQAVIDPVSWRSFPSVGSGDRRSLNKSFIRYVDDSSKSYLLISARSDFGDKDAEAHAPSGANVKHPAGGMMTVQAETSTSRENGAEAEQQMAEADLFPAVNTPFQEEEAAEADFVGTTIPAKELRAREVLEMTISPVVRRCLRRFVARLRGRRAMTSLSSRDRQILEDEAEFNEVRKQMAPALRYCVAREVLPTLSALYDTCYLSGISVALWQKADRELLGRCITKDWAGWHVTFGEQTRIPKHSVGQIKPRKIVKSGIQEAELREALSMIQSAMVQYHERYHKEVELIAKKRTTV